MKGSIAAAETYKSSPLSLIVHTEAHKSFPRFSQASLALSAPKQSISRSNKTNYHIDNTNPFLIPKTSDSQSNSSQFCRCCDGNKSLCVCSLALYLVETSLLTAQLGFELSCVTISHGKKLRVFLISARVTKPRGSRGTGGSTAPLVRRCNNCFD